MNLLVPLPHICSVLIALRLGGYMLHHWRLIFYMVGLFFMPYNTAFAGPVQAYESYILPIPPITGLNEKKVSLGRDLFYEKKLSGDNSISCAHCHQLEKGGADGLVHAIGVAGAEGVINTPTVYNVVYNIAQFWDGRATTLEELVDDHIQNKAGMDSNWQDIIKKLKHDPHYAKRFKKAYGRKGLVAANIENAIATFERSLVTSNAPFDLFLAGNRDAISQDAKKGFELFQSYGCVSCHQGANVGGNMFQTMGLFGDYFEDRGDITRADEGRFAVTGRPLDNYKFKVPSLRLVTLTAPYFHDGSIDTLSAAIQIMAQYELGRMIPEDDIQFIIAFLHALKGELQSGEPQ